MLFRDFKGELNVSRDSRHISMFTFQIIGVGLVHGVPEAEVIRH